jgi:hypothetical protein
MSYMRSTSSIGKIQTMMTLEASSTKPKKRRNPRKETRLKSHKRKEKSQNLYKTDEALKVFKTLQEVLQVLKPLCTQNSYGAPTSS